MPLVQLEPAHWNVIPAPPPTLSDVFFWTTTWRVLDKMDRKRRRLKHRMYRNKRSPSRRAVITMFYLQDLSMEEIGKRLGCDESRVGQIHLEAVTELRREFVAMTTTWRQSHRDGA